MNTNIPDLTADFLSSEEFLILIPKNDKHHIAPGSGICAKALEKASPGSTFKIDYEGNLYGASNVKSHEQKLLHAAGRSDVNYPTVARIWMEKPTMLENFHIVGTLNYQQLRSLLQARICQSEEEAVQKSWNIYPEQQDNLKAWANKQPA